MPRKDPEEFRKYQAEQMKRRRAQAKATSELPKQAEAQSTSAPITTVAKKKADTSRPPKVHLPPKPAPANPPAPVKPSAIAKPRPADPPEAPLLVIQKQTYDEIGDLNLQKDLMEVIRQHPGKQTWLYIVKTDSQKVTMKFNFDKISYNPQLRLAMEALHLNSNGLISYEDPLKQAVLAL